MPSFAGFDTGSYPGDSLMTAWSAGNSPYSFVGFYLDAPCHTPQYFLPWAGKYRYLYQLGWGLIVIYFGRQQTGCGSTSLSRAQGEADGADTIAKCQAEGFPPGAIVYLDVEHFDGPMSPAMSDYYRGWLIRFCEAALCSPALTAPRRMRQRAGDRATGVHGAGGEGAPSIWIVKSDPAFNPAASDPTGCGIPFADVWQGQARHSRDP